MEAYLALDPGKTTGWALFSLDGKPIQMGYVEYGPKLFTTLMMIEPKFYVVEEFMLIDKETARRNRINHYTQKWDKVFAARVIGAIEQRAAYLNVPVHFQRPIILKTASNAFGLSLTKFNKLQHPIDAILHGAYYAWKNMGILPVDLGMTQPHFEEQRETTVVTMDDYSQISKLTKKQIKKSK